MAGRDKTSWIDEPVLVHVGLPKTATSWLQDFYLSKPQYGFWHPVLPMDIPRPVKGTGHLFVRSPDAHLMQDDDFDPAEIRRQLSAFSNPPGLMPVVSNERLAGHPISNGFDRRQLALRIRSVFPKARILITIREQNALILSSYMQYLKFGGWHSLERYLRPETDYRQPVLTLQFWNYARLIALYHEAFGEANVLMLPYEILKRSPDEFLAHIARFAGVPPPEKVDFGNIIANRRKSHVASYYLRRMTSLRRKTSANAFKPSLLPLPVGQLLDLGAKAIVTTLTPAAVERRMENHMAMTIKRAVGSEFAPSNVVAAEKSGFDLAELGYIVS